MAGQERPRDQDPRRGRRQRRGRHRRRRPRRPAPASASTTPSASSSPSLLRAGQGALARRDHPLHAVGPQLALRPPDGAGPPRRSRRGPDVPADRAPAGVQRARLDHPLPEPGAGRAARRHRHAVHARLRQRPRPGRRTERLARDPADRREIPPSLQRVDLEVWSPAARSSSRSRPTPTSPTTFVWDGRDAYGRPVQGRQPVRSGSATSMACAATTRPASSTPRSGSSPAPRARSSARSATIVEVRQLARGARRVRHRRRLARRPRHRPRRLGARHPPRLRRAHAHALPRRWPPGRRGAGARHPRQHVPRRRPA